MQWSEYQLAIFDAIARQRQSLIVNAVAGSGKTTTIVEAISHVPAQQSVAFLAFNKAIAEELKRRIKAPNAKCMTLHAAGFAAWKGFLQFDASLLEVDGKKTRKMVDALELSWADTKKFGPQLGRLVSIAKGVGIVPKEGVADAGQYKGLVPDDRDVWEELIELYGLDEDEIDLDITRMVLAKSIEHARMTIDYDDMLYMPIITGAGFEKFDVVFLDEAQDVNGIQVEMVGRMQKGMSAKCDCAPSYDKESQVLDELCPLHGRKEYRGSRVIAVGDPHQAIYGFRGALSNSMDVIAERFDCKELPLSVSYRCPKAVVEHAQQFVPHIESHVDAAEGLVESPAVWQPSEFTNSDAILCRVARPLIEIAFLLIRAKVGCRVLGRDIGQGLVKLVQKMKARTMDDLWEKLGQHRHREIEKMRRRAGHVDEGKVAMLDDKIDTINVFIEALDKTDSIEQLIRSIEGLFGEASDGTRLLTLATVHKSKGLEWDRVFILDAQEHMPSPWARQPWQQVQEGNLQYVAITRAKRELRYVTGDALRIGAERQACSVAAVGGGQ